VITRRISSLFRRSKEDDKDLRGPVRSEPHVRIRRPKTSSADLPSGESSKPHKGKQRVTRPSTSCAPYASTSSRSKSTEPGQRRRRNHGTASLSALHAPSSSGRHGSTTGLVDAYPSASSQSSPTTTASDKPRTRFGFLFNPITSWRPNKFSSQAPSPTTTTAPSSLNDTSIHQRVTRSIQTGGRTKVTRRSEEALWQRQHNPSDDNMGLTAERRASSWGQGDQPAGFSEVLNFQSVRDERSDCPFPSASYPAPHSDQPSLAPKAPSRLSNVPAALPSKQGISDEEQEFGPACIDEDSSTIASARGTCVSNDGEWQNGSDLEDGDGNDDDDSDDQDDQAVTFLSRRR
jgi:SNF1-activating kinase 1